MISKKTKYALKALIQLAERHRGNKPVLISEIAERDRLPKKFLELILLELKNKGILQSKKGKGGGYLLAQPPDKISLGAILRILEGPLALLPCASVTAYRKCDECKDENTCGLKIVMNEVRESTARILDGTTLQDVLDRSQSTSEMYFI
jgi:Rrf2 family protein